MFLSAVALLIFKIKLIEIFMKQKKFKEVLNALIQTIMFKISYHIAESVESGFNSNISSMIYSMTLE